MIFRIETPKPPEDIWPVAIDFTARLDIEGGETIDAADIVAYKVADYSQELTTLDLSDAERITVIVERQGRQASVYSYPVCGQPNLRLLFPATYPREESDVVDPNTLIIGPQEGGGAPPQTHVGFKIRGGEPGASYEVYLQAITNKGNIHSCILRFRVEAITS